MTVDTRTRFDVVPLSKHIGAEIHGLDLREKPDEATTRAIYRTWLDHLVIVFPSQTSVRSASCPGRPNIFPRAIRACCRASC